MAETRHFEFDLQIGTDEYLCTRDRLPRHDLVKFREITDNISETVQDRDIIAIED